MGFQPTLQRPSNLLSKVDRQPHRLPHLQGSKVDDIVNIRVIFKHLVQGSLVSNVKLIEDRSLSAEKFDAVDDFF